MNNRIFKFIFIACIGCLLHIEKTNAQMISDSTSIDNDTIIINEHAVDSLQTAPMQFYIEPDKQSKSGTLAMILSAIIPGAGQVYAQRYYTIPLIYGFGAYFASVAIKQEKFYQEYRVKYAESVRMDTVNHVGDSNFKKIRDFYHNQRDEFILYFTLTYILNIIDAYVGATLYDFSVSDNLGGSVEIKFKIPFH